MIWFQCDIITHEGGIDYWCRFIAKDKTAAKERTRRVWEKAVELRSGWTKTDAKRFIAAFKISKVPDHILSRYNLNDPEDVERFYDRKKG